MELLYVNSVGHTWLDLIAFNSLNTKYSYTIQNIGTTEVRFSSKATQPSFDYDDLFILAEGEKYTFPKGQAGIFFLNEETTQTQGKIAIAKTGATDITAALRKSERLAEPRLLVQTNTQLEAASIEGRMHFLLLDITMAIGETKWITFRAPADKEVAVISRVFQPAYTGFEYDVYVGSSGFTNDQTLTPKRMNLSYGTTSTAVIRTLTGAPSVVGTLHDIPVFQKEAGQNPSQRAVGTSSLDQGYQIYPASGGFEGRLINTSSVVNRVVVRIEWMEVPLTLLEV